MQVSTTLMKLGVILFAVCVIPAGLYIEHPGIRFLAILSSTAMFVIIATVAVAIKRSGLDEIYQKRYEELKRQSRIRRMAAQNRKAVLKNKEKNKGK